MSDRIFDSTIGALNTSANLRLLNQNVISSNVANADTPKYQAKRLDFEEAFRDALGVGDDLVLETSDPKHIAPHVTDPVHPEIYEHPNDIFSLDGNTVDRNAEMAKMAENQIMYNATVEMLKKKLGLMKYVVSEGGSNR